MGCEAQLKEIQTCLVSSNVRIYHLKTWPMDVDSIPLPQIINAGNVDYKYGFQYHEMDDQYCLQPSVPN